MLPQGLAVLDGPSPVLLALPWPAHLSLPIGVCRAWILVAAACLLDRLLGDPRGWLHPVQVMGAAISALRRLAEAWAGDRPRALRLAGAGITLVVVGLSALVGWSVEQLARTAPLLGLPLLLLALASALAGRSLEQAVQEVLSALPDAADPVAASLEAPAAR
ncbi:MAG: cobalamin biosynthesis protein, partial [Cyanobium sp.]